MPVAILATMAFGLIHGALLAAAWCAARRLAAPLPERPPPPAWPSVSIILPFSGTGSALSLSLGDLAGQDYPVFDIRLACHAEDQPARDFAQAWIQERSARGGPSIRLAQAETARRCGQKNQNLLAALGTLEAADDILVFTDADYRRPPDWLRQLVAPIAAGEAAVSSGYYFAVPGTGWRSALRPVTALLLFLTRQYPALRQTWGGATAISRQLFAELKVADLWATNVVDDVALAERLRQARIPVAGIHAAPMLAGAKDSADFDWGEWLTRQLAYLRAIQPLAWAGLGIGLFLLAAGLLWMAGLILFAWATPTTFRLAGIAALDGLLLAALGLKLRAAHPQPGSRRAWLAAFFWLILAAPGPHLRTAFSRTIRWRGIHYQVDNGGRVLATSAKPIPPPATTPEPARPHQA